MMSSLNRCSFVVASLCLVLGTPVLHAQGRRPATVTHSREATEALRQADAAFQANQLDLALTQYQRTLALSHDPSVLFNLGRTFFALRRWSDAIATWDRFVIESRDESARAAVDEMLAEAHHELDLDTSTARPVAATGAAGVQGSGPLANGSRQTQALPSRGARTVTRAPTGAWVLTGVGAAGVVTGAITGALYFSSLSSLQSEQNCTPIGMGQFRCDPAALPLAQGTSTLGNVAWSSLAVGSAVLTTGLLWAVLGRRAESTSVYAVLTGERVEYGLVRGW